MPCRHLALGSVLKGLDSSGQPEEGLTVDIPSKVNALSYKSQQVP